MSLHRRFLSRFRKPQTSGARIPRHKALARATTPVLENLEGRQMLAIQPLAGGIRIIGNGFSATTGLPLSQNYEFVSNGNVPTRISVAGNAEIDVLFAGAVQGAQGQGSSITYGQPLPPQQGQQNNLGLPQGDIFAIYVNEGDMNSFVSVSEFNPVPANRPAVPFSQSLNVTVRIRPSGALGVMSTDTDTGRIILGTRTLDTVQNQTTDQDQPIGSAVLASDFGDLDAGDVVVPGLKVRDGVDLGKFLFAGLVTGVVDIGGNMDTFYAGNLLTGTGLGEATLTTSLPNNFRVDGDLRNLLVRGSIGTLEAAGNGARPSYSTGFDLDVRGKLGNVFAGGNIAAIGNIKNVVNAGGLTSIQREVEARGTGLTPRPGGLDFVQVQFNWNNGFVNTGTFNNDDFDHPQFLYSVNNEIHVQGNLIAVAATGDFVDYYGVSLMAGQKIEYKLDSSSLLGLDPTLFVNQLNSNLLQVGVIDPDGRLIATDYTDVDRINLGNQRFRFTAEKPGVYRFVVAVPNNDTFTLGGGPTASATPYNLHIYNVGEIGVGGINTNGTLTDSDAAGLVFVDPDTGLPPDPDDPETPIDGANTNVGWQLDRGDWGAYRSNGTIFSNTGIGFINPATLRTEYTATLRILNGNLRSVSGNEIGAWNGAGTGAGSAVEVDVPFGSVGEIRANNRLAVNVANPATAPTFGRIVPTTIDYNFVNGDYQRVVSGGVFLGTLVANRRIGSINVGSMATLTPSIITVNADNLGNDGIIDIIDVRGALGTLNAGGPWISTGPRGNVRYMNAEGAVFSDLFFGGGTATTTVYPRGEGDIFRDDSGVKYQVSPTNNGQLQALTYGIRGSGGVAMVRLTTDGGLNVQTLGRTAKGSVELGKIISTGAPATTMSFSGRKLLDVLYITGGDFTRIFNQTEGEIVTVRAANIANIEAKSLGMTRRGGTAAVVLPGDVLSDAYPFDDARFGILATNGINQLRTRGALGNVLVTGGNLDNVLINSDGVTKKKAFDGLLGAIFSQGNIDTVNIGKGTGAAGNGQAGVTGVYAVGTIDEVIGTGNADLRGNVVSQQRINSITLRGGSIINSNIMVVTTLNQARDIHPAGYVLPDDGDQFTNPSYEIGTVSVEGGGSGGTSGRGGRGNSRGSRARRGRGGRGGGGSASTAQGGIIGTFFLAADMGTIQVENGFGIFNSQIVAQFDGRVDLISADGYGIRDTFINSSALLREVVASGTGKQVKATSASASVRQTEKNTFDPFFQYRPNRLTDIHAFLGTSKASPNNGDATRTGIIAGIDARGGRRLNELRAFEVRGSFTGIDSVDLDGNPITVPYFDSTFNFANEIEDFIVKRDLLDADITTGRIGTLNVGRDLGSSTAGPLITVAGIIDQLRVKRHVGLAADVRAIGPDGDINDLNVGGGIAGSVIAEQDILRARVKGQVTGTLADKDGPITPRK